MGLTELKVGARRLVGDRSVRRIKARRLQLLERVPGRRSPATGLNGLDLAIIPLVAESSSRTFLEFGANDGLQQSNTYVLERDHGWRGVLVEPLVGLARECEMNRPLSQVVCAAVSRPDVAGTLLRFDDADLMTRQGSGSDHAVAVTMSTLIDEFLDGEVGLAVVDVEGFELDALAGLDLSRHRPEFLLVETAQLGAVTELLGDGYAPPQQLTYHDYLFARR